MDAVLDSGGLSAWAKRRPPQQLLELLEVVAATGGVVVVPTVTVVESTTGRQRDDASINHRLRRALVDDCTLRRAREAARLRFRARAQVSAVDAVVAATALDRLDAALVTADPGDLSALIRAGGGGHQIVEV